MTDKLSINEELFHKGELYSAESYLGCSFVKKRDEYIYTFRTYAPNAEAVHLASDYNGWADSLIPLSKNESGIWECKVISSFTLEGYAYKYVIRAKGTSVYKGDPYAKYSKGGSDGASVIWTSSFAWTDGEWLSARAKQAKNAKSTLSLPLNAYAVYPSDFIGFEGEKHPSYRELASSLVPYIRYMGYTHLRLLCALNTDGAPDGGGMFSTAYRHGTPDDLKYLVNELHKFGIGIILDWNATHLTDTEWSARCFDGAYLYESPSVPGRIDTSQPENVSFVLSSLSYALREYHSDGICIKGLDKANEADRALLDRISALAKKEFRDVIFISDFQPESGGAQNLIRSSSYSDNVADYLATDPLYRASKHAAITDIPLGSISHLDRRSAAGRSESIVSSIHGSYDDKFRQLRTVMLYHMCLPFKKEAFMGHEFARFSDWEKGRALEWFMLGYPAHKKMRQYVCALNRFYVKSPELWQLDGEEGFVLISSSEKCCTAVIKRKSHDSHLFVAINMSGVNQCVTIPTDGKLQCVFSSEENMTSERTTEISENGQSYIKVSLLPYSARIYKPLQVNNKIIL